MAISIETEPSEENKAVLRELHELIDYRVPLKVKPAA